MTTPCIPGTAGLLFLLAVSSTLAQQAPAPPSTWHNSRASGSFATFNGTSQFTNLEQRETQYLRTGHSTGASSTGSANQIVSMGGGEGLLQQTAASGMQAIVHYGHLSYSGSAQVVNNGTVFTNPAPGNPETRYITRRGEVAASVTSGYQDILFVESDTLPAGTPVTLQMKLEAWGTRTTTVVTPVTVTIPPTGPGFPPTTVQELRPTTETAEALPDSNSAGWVISRADGSYVSGSFLERRIKGISSANITVQVGWQLKISHSAYNNVGAQTEGPSGDLPGNYTAQSVLAFYTDFHCRAVTEGARLRSLSGHSYAPLTGTAGLLQVRSAPGLMVLTAPEGVFFQKARHTPAGLEWDTLVETRMLAVPLTETRAFFRAVQP